MKDEKDLSVQADSIYLISLMLAQIAIWLLVMLLVYSEFKIGMESLSANTSKMIIVAIITVGLVALSFFLTKVGKKKNKEHEKRRGEMIS